MSAPRDARRDEPAFPLAFVSRENGKGVVNVADGMTLRDYFAVRAPEPTKDEIDLILRMEQQANPHGDSYKPRRRGVEEIKCALRYRFADAMLKARDE